MTSWDARHRLVADTAFALALAVVLVPVSAEVWTSAPGWLPPVATLSMCAALVPRRTWPAASAAAIYGIALLHLMLGPELIAGDLLVLVALYSVTVHGPRWAYVTAIVGALAGSVLYGMIMVLEGGAAFLAPAAVVTTLMGLMSITVFAVALVIRSRRTSVDALRERAARLEAERDRQATEAAAAERARIAREMHDIVAHSLSVIIAQADGGRYAAAQDPQAAARALDTVAETGRAALGDMRRLLGVLRTGGTAGREDARGAGGAAPATPTAGRATGSPAPDGSGPDDEDAPALRPQPGLGDLDHLVEQVRSGGPRVSLVRMGTPRLLPPGTGLAAYRIAQESLTNVLKHGGPDVTATVLLQWRPASLVLEVSDDGRGAGAPSDGAGQGLLGMRERATMLGGTFVAGPRPGGGYRVRAEIPLPLHRPLEEHA